MAEVVGEGHPHLEGRAQVGVDQGVGARILARNVRLVRAVHPDPLVRVSGAGQPVGVGNTRGRGRQRLPDLRRAGDGRRARRGDVRHSRERRRRRAGACLLAAQDVDEAHLDLDLLAPLVGGQGVGDVGLVGDVLLVRRAVGVHPHPLVGEHVVQDVVIHDAVRQGRQLFIHLDRAGNDRVTRRRMVRRQAQPQRALDAGRPGGANVPPIALKLCKEVWHRCTAEVVGRVADMQPQCVDHLVSWVPEINVLLA